MKKVLIPVLIIISINFSPKSVLSYDCSYDNQIKNPIQTELYEKSLLTLLYPYISKEIDRYYGHPKQFDFEKIISIKKTPEKNEFEITVQVETFTGAHNPPRGKETITIVTSAMGTKVINFKHESE